MSWSCKECKKPKVTKKDGITTVSCPHLAISTKDSDNDTDE